jgi:hypothetical protein
MDIRRIVAVLLASFWVTVASAEMPPVLKFADGVTALDQNRASLARVGYAFSASASRSNHVIFNEKRERIPLDPPSVASFAVKVAAGGGRYLQTTEITSGPQRGRLTTSVVTPEGQFLLRSGATDEAEYVFNGTSARAAVLHGPIEINPDAFYETLLTSPFVVDWEKAGVRPQDGTGVDAAGQAFVYREYRAPERVDRVEAVLDPSTRLPVRVRRLTGGVRDREWVVAWQPIAGGAALLPTTIELRTFLAPQRPGDPVQPPLNSEETVVVDLASLRTGDEARRQIVTPVVAAETKVVDGPLVRRAQQAGGPVDPGSSIGWTGWGMLLSGTLVGIGFWLRSRGGLRRAR